MAAHPAQEAEIYRTEIRNVIFRMFSTPNCNSFAKIRRYKLTGENSLRKIDDSKLTAQVQLTTW